LSAHRNRLQRHEEKKILRAEKALDAGIFAKRSLRTCSCSSYDNPSTGHWQIRHRRRKWSRRMEIGDINRLPLAIRLLRASAFKRAEEFSRAFSRLIASPLGYSAGPADPTPRSAIKLIRQVVAGIIQMLETTDGEYEVSVWARHRAICLRST